MNIKQEYKEDGKEYVNFTYIGEPRGVIFDGSIVTFRNGGTELKFFITEIEELMPYFQAWINGQ